MKKNNRKSFQETYIDFSILKNLSDEEKELVLFMYKNLIKTLLSEPDFREKYRNMTLEESVRSNLMQSANHIINNLFEIGFLTDDIRELNINKIID